MSYDYNHIKEVNEAIRAGEQALYSLQEADRYMGSARNWGIIDMLGGGFFSSLIKHSKVNSAQECLNRAQWELESFNRELADVRMHCAAPVEFDGLTQFVDVLCDNFWVDLLVQSRISEARNSIQQAIYRVQTVLDRLYRERG